MSYIKRAWLSVVRRKGKSLILLIVVFILGNLIAGTFAIKQATERVESNLKTKLGFNATVTLDWESIWEDFDHMSNDMPEMPKVPAELVERLGGLPQVNFYDYSRKSYVSTKSFKSVSFGDMDDMEGPSQFALQGVEYLDILDSKIGRIDLASGRTFKADDLEGDEIPVLVSEEFMNKNSFRLDEVIDMKKEAQMFMEFGEEDSSEAKTFDYKLRIVGTFNPVTFGKDKNNNWSVVEMMNRIYMPNASVLRIIEDEIKSAEEAGMDMEDNSYFQEMAADNFEDTVFVTDSLDDLEGFVSEASLLIEDGLIIKTSQDAFSTMASSISILRDISNVMLKGSTIVTIVVLTLVVVLFLRDRKHEMGIYLAIGDHQWKVLMQVTLEVLMITIIGLTLSFGSGVMLANKASEALMQDRYGEEVQIDTQSSYIPAVNLTEMDEDYNIKITPSYVVSTYAIGAGVAIAASVIPMFYVTRMKPKKILM